VRGGLEAFALSKAIVRAANPQGAGRMKPSSLRHQNREADFCYQHCRTVCAEAILTAGHDWRLSSFNSGAQKLLGYSADEMIGRPVDVLLKDGTAELVRLKQLLDSLGDVQEFESVMVGKSESEIPVRLSVSLLKDTSGRPNGCVAIATI
jgi:PAS domain S-box-containing protein